METLRRNESGNAVSKKSKALIHAFCADSYPLDHLKIYASLQAYFMPPFPSILFRSTPVLVRRGCS